MARRKMTEEELERAASKEWKQTPIFTSDEKVAYKAKNLTGPKTPEGKKRSLQNLQVGRNNMDKPTNLRHGGYIQKILTEDEQELYLSRREDYVKDTAINGSADEIILHTVLMEEVIYYRLMKKQAEKPSLDIDRPLSECTRRMRTALEDLGALRKQRLKQDDKTTAVSIASIAQQFARGLMNGTIKETLAQQAEEERQFLENKKKRDAGKEVEPDYEIIEEADEK